MSAMASQITGVSVVCLIACSGADQRKHRSSTSPAFVWWIHRWPVDSPNKGPVTRKRFLFDDVIMHGDRYADKQSKTKARASFVEYTLGELALYGYHKVNHFPWQHIACCTEKQPNKNKNNSVANVLHTLFSGGIVYYQVVSSLEAEELQSTCIETVMLHF